MAKKHWATYLIPFGPCREGYHAARKHNTPQQFWDAVKKNKPQWLWWLWGVTSFGDKDLQKDMVWLNNQQSLVRDNSRSHYLDGLENFALNSNWCLNLNEWSLYFYYGREDTIIVDEFVCPPTSWIKEASEKWIEALEKTFGKEEIEQEIRARSRYLGEKLPIG